MKLSKIVIGLALAVASPAFAQDASTAPATPPRSSTTTPPADTATPPAESTQTPTAAEPAKDDTKAAAPMKKAAHTKKMKGVDRGHVAGDPPIIDHSADHLIVEPTSSSGKAPASTN